MKKIITLIIIGIIITFSLHFKKGVNEERNLTGFQEVQKLECTTWAWGDEKCRIKCVQHWVFDDGSKEFIKEYYKKVS